MKVLITNSVPEEGLLELKRKHDVIMPEKGNIFTEEELLNIAPEIDAVIQAKTKIKVNFISKAKKLKVISVIGVGYDGVDLESANKRKIYVTNNPRIVTECTAEFSFAMMLAVSRRIVEADYFVRYSNNQKWDLNLLNGHNLFDKKVGIIGFGRIGQSFARRCECFGMQVFYFDPLINQDSSFHAEPLPFREILIKSDYISLHVPYCSGTHHLINESELNEMKNSAFLINASRGAVVHQQALIDALKSHKIAGAALDVYETEPSVPKELTELPNVVLSPHIGTSTIETRIAMARESANKVLQVLEGKIPEDLVNWNEIIASNENR